MAARRARLIYVSDCEPGYRRQRRGKGFVYLDARGRQITDARVIARIKSLAIPPAYTDVWICRSARGHMQATARDARGRKQYRYHPLWKTWRDDSKFGRMADFARALTKLRARITRDLRRHGLVRERVLATIVRLLDRTHVRNIAGGSSPPQVSKIISACAPAAACAARYAATAPALRSSSACIASAKHRDKCRVKACCACRCRDGGNRSATICRLPVSRPVAARNRRAACKAFSSALHWQRRKAKAGEHVSA
jgi:hypothetical protein